MRKFSYYKKNIQYDFSNKAPYTLKYVNILTIQGHSKFAKEKLTNVYRRYQM